jgi:hypothetical protein
VLLELARGATVEQLERMIRSWKKSNRHDEAALERERFESRTFSVFPDDDGMYVVRGRLTPDVGALLMRAIEAAGDALFREQRVRGGPVRPEIRSGRRRSAVLIRWACWLSGHWRRGSEPRGRRIPPLRCPSAAHVRSATR